MTHISRTKTGQFIVAVLGKNGKVLMTSEPLKTRQAAIKNIAAVVDEFDDSCVYVQDNTKGNSVVHFVFYDGDIQPSSEKPGKPYQPK